MKHSLRKTPSLLHLVYKYDGAGGNVTGCHLTLSCEGSLMTLAVDLSGNFRARDRAIRTYLDAVTLARDHHKLKFVQCHDTLVRTRLVRAWEQVAHPRDPRIAFHLEQRAAALVGRLEVAEAGFGIDHHGAELEHLEVLAVLTDTGLLEEHRALVAGLDGDGDGGDQW